MAVTGHFDNSTVSFSLLEAPAPLLRCHYFETLFKDGRKTMTCQPHLNRHYSLHQKVQSHVMCALYGLSRAVASSICSPSSCRQYIPVSNLCRSRRGALSSRLRSM